LAHCGDTVARGMYGALKHVHPHDGLLRRIKSGCCMYVHQVCICQCDGLKILPALSQGSGVATPIPRWLSIP